MNYNDLMLQVSQIYSADGKGETSDITPMGMTLGIVVDVDDPLQQGRVRIFCPSLNDNPKKLQHLPWAAYSSPYGGSINNKCFTRGNDPDNCTTTGATQYGFWGIPEQGAHLLVGCIDGDTRRRFYIGSLYEHQETHGILTGRWHHSENGGVAGPLSSTDAPIEPQYTNLLKAFNKDNTAREWRTRAADYQVCGVREDIGQVPNGNKPTYLDQQYDKISQYEPDDWVKPIVGANGYDWSGYKSLGSFMASRVYGMSTPGFHSFTMDDRAFNSRVKIRTGAGHQIIMDDTNERIYISTYEGNNWIEMDVSGNIDIYSKRRISVHAEKDINLTSDETVRIKGKKGVHIYAGDNQKQDSLGTPPLDGEIRIQSEADMHLITKQNLRVLSFQDTLLEIGGKMCQTIGDSLYLQVEKEINITTNLGDFNTTVAGNLNEFVQGNTNKFATGTMTNASKGAGQLFSFSDKMDIGSQLAMNVKSISQDVSLEATGANPNTSGGVFLKSPESQLSVSSQGITLSTNKSIKHKAAEDIQMQNAVPKTNQDYPSPPPQDIGDCAIGDHVPTDGFSGADLVARLAYNAGFRGDGLVTAVAIASAESSFNTGAVGDYSIQDNKWGPSMGLWQIRTLKHPTDYAGSVDAKRDINTIGGSQNAQANANLAFELSKGGTNWKPWSTYPTTYLQSNNINPARAAVSAMCNPTVGISMTEEEVFLESFSASAPLSIIEQCIAADLGVVGNLFNMHSGGIGLQSLGDFGFKNQLSSTNLMSGIYTQLNNTSIAHDIHVLATSIVIGGLASGIAPGIAAAIAYGVEAASILGVISGIIGGGIPDFTKMAAQLLTNIGLNFLVHDICSYAIPHFNNKPQLIFFSENHSQAGGTCIGTPASSGSIPDFRQILDYSGG